MAEQSTGKVQKCVNSLGETVLEVLEAAEDNNKTKLSIVEEDHKEEEVGTEVKVGKEVKIEKEEKVEKEEEVDKDDSSTDSE